MIVISSVDELVEALLWGTFEAAGREEVETAVRTFLDEPRCDFAWDCYECTQTLAGGPVPVTGQRK